MTHLLNSTFGFLSFSSQNSGNKALSCLLLSSGWCYNEDGRSLLDTEWWGCMVMHLMRPIPVSPSRWGEPSLQERTKSVLVFVTSLIISEQTVRINTKHLSEPSNLDIVASLYTLGKCSHNPSDSVDLFSVRCVKHRSDIASMGWNDQISERRRNRWGNDSGLTEHGLMGSRVSRVN